MTRQFTAALAVLLFGCDQGAPSVTAPPSRVQAVVAQPVDDPLADFCEVRADAASARRFVWPALDAAPPPAEGGWTWVNVWATWCGPCIEEMPRVSAWEETLRKDLGPGAVRFLSVDADTATVDAFRVKHPATPPSSRLQDLGALTPFLGSLGLDGTAALPLQIFLDRSQRIRCVRVGAVEDKDLARVTQALSAR